MKKMVSVFLTVCLLSVSAKANILDYLVDYGLPCLVGLGLGSAMSSSSKDGTAIGVSICGAVSTSTFLNTRRMETEMKDEDFKKIVKLMNERIDERDQKFLAEQKQENEQLKELMKEVMAERMVSIEEKMKSDIKEYVERSEFMKDVEKKVLDRIKTEVSSETSAQKKKIVEEVVDEVLKKIVVKKYGTSKDDVVE